MRLRQFLWSLTGFALLLAAVIAVDERARDQFERLVWGGDGITSIDNRLVDLSESVMMTMQSHGFEGGPILVFAGVGLLLFFFMVRT